MNTPKLIGFFSIFIFFFSIFNFSSAQSLENEINFKLFPETPQANEKVIVEINSLSVNLNNHFITWYLNNKKQSSDYGLTQFSFISGAVGKNSTVSVIIQLNQEQVIKKTVLISPIGLDLLWEAVDSYTPPFYKGKSLPTREKTIKIVAMPNSKNFNLQDAHDLIYYWKKDRKSVGAASGYGRQSYLFDRDLLKTSENIAVEITDRSGKEGLRSSISFNSFFSPEIVLYLKDASNRLLLNVAVTNNDTVDDDFFTLSAQPYFFSKNLNNLEFNWNINDQEITPSGDLSPTDISLFPEEGVDSAQILISTKNIKKIFEKASSTLFINI